MSITIEKRAGFALIHSDSVCITDIQSALEIMMQVHYETECDAIAISKDAIAEDFFDLSTKIAGEILQKFTTYHYKFAIYGDFSNYTGKAFNDFVYECNKGRHIFFAKDIDEASTFLKR